MDRTSDLLPRYTDLAIARRDLESSQLGAAWEHFSKCRPLSKKYGLYLPCHENFKTAMSDLDDGMPAFGTLVLRKFFGAIEGFKNSGPDGMGASCGL